MTQEGARFRPRVWPIVRAMTPEEIAALGPLVEATGGVGTFNADGLTVAEALSTATAPLPPAPVTPLTPAAPVTPPIAAVAAAAAPPAVAVAGADDHVAAGGVIDHQQLGLPEMAQHFHHMWG